MRKQKPIPTIYTIIFNDCMELRGMKLARKVSKALIEEMCNNGTLAVSFESLEENDFFCIYISQSNNLILCQLIPDKLNEEGVVIKTGEQITLMTIHGSNDISRLFKNCIWKNAECIKEEDALHEEKLLITTN